MCPVPQAGRPGNAPRSPRPQHQFTCLRIPSLGPPAKAWLRRGDSACGCQDRAGRLRSAGVSPLRGHLGRRQPRLYGHHVGTSLWGLQRLPGGVWHKSLTARGAIGRRYCRRIPPGIAGTLAGNLGRPVVVRAQSHKRNIDCSCRGWASPGSRHPEPADSRPAAIPPPPIDPDSVSWTQES